MLGKRVIGIVIVVFLIVFFGFMILFSYSNYIKLRAKYDTMVEKEKELIKQNKELRVKLNAIVNDTAFIEEMARRDLGMVYPNEVVFAPADRSVEGNE